MTTASLTKADEFLNTLRNGWILALNLAEKGEKKGAEATYTLLAYPWYRKELYKAYEQAQIEFAGLGLFLQWTEKEEFTKSASITISNKPISEHKSPVLEPKKASKKAKENLFKPLAKRK